MTIALNLEYARKNEGYYYGEGSAMLAERVAMVLDVANDFTPPWNNSHRDSGRGQSIDCGEFLI